MVVDLTADTRLGSVGRNSGEQVTPMNRPGRAGGLRNFCLSGSEKKGVLQRRVYTFAGNNGEGERGKTLEKDSVDYSEESGQTSV